jgi:hypothetical protein
MRGVPIVFVSDESERLDQTKRVLPSAVYCSWRGIAGALRRAIASPPRADGPPPSVFAGYSGTPLPKKLGIKPSCVVALLNAPENFVSILGEFPTGVTFQTNCDGAANLTLWFLRSAAELKKDIRKIARAIGDAGRLWMIWPKKASGVQTDVTESLIRQTGLANGLVDYKICAVDQTWSGLLFKRRS